MKLFEGLTPIDQLKTDIDQYKDLFDIGMFTKPVLEETVADLIRAEFRSILDELTLANQENNFQRYYDANLHNLKIRKLIHELGSIIPINSFKEEKVEILRVTEEIILISHREWVYSPELTALVRSGEYNKYPRR